MIVSASRPGLALLAALSLSFIAGAARADAIADYLAARDAYVRQIKQIETDPAKQDEMFALNDRATSDLKKRLMAVLGPRAFKGLEKDPRFLPEAFYEGDLGSGAPDGLIYADKKDETRIFVTPEPVLADWLVPAAKSPEAPAGFSRGVTGAIESESLYTYTVGQDAAFALVFRLPLAAKEGETVFAAAGLFSQDGEADYPPNSIVVARVFKDTVMIAATPVAETRKGIAACSRAYKKQSAEAAKLAPGSKGPPDAAATDRWMTALSAAVSDFRTCFAQEAPKQAFFAPLVARAEALLAKMRGE